MSKSANILTRQQKIGIVVLLGVLALIFIGLHYLPQPQIQTIPSTDTIKQAITTDKQHYYDSLHTARKAHYDSLRIARRDSLHQVYEQYYDSVHRVDSLWWDSVYQSTPHPVKKDTIIDLNNADTTALKLIRGIGSGMARRIVRYRDQLGGFASTKQLLDNQLYMDQYGHSIKAKYAIPDSVLNSFVVTADSVHPILVNHASIERLQAHPYISHNLAKEIYTYRRKHIRIKNIDELRNLHNMTDSLFNELTPYLSFEQ